MKFLSKHWYDLGGVFTLIVAGYLLFALEDPTRYQLITWLSLISLFLHQLEEYRIWGTFPGMTNGKVFNSETPDRYPLNALSSVYVNVFVGWGSYLLAAIFAERTVWLGIATMLVSIGNVFGHVILFNVRGRTLLNAGILTSVLLFAPLSFFFFETIHAENLAAAMDYWIGIPLGLVLNFAGILGIIFLLKNQKTTYVFPQRNLLKSQRNKQV